MELVNLTPHPLVLALPSGERITVPPSGTVARVATLPASVATVEGLPVPVAPAPRFGAVEGLPAPREGVALLVSAMVLARCAGRGDVFAPGTGPADGALRNAAGHVEAVTRLLAAPLE